MDERKCPNCNNANACQIAEGKSICWCFFENIPKDSFKRDREDSCYCLKCLSDNQDIE